MSNSNVVYLPTWFESQEPPPETRYCFATTRETFELLAAFSQIESPVVRKMIIEMTRGAVRASGLGEPPRSASQTSGRGPRSSIGRSEKIFSRTYHESHSDR
jgi:hypothetical protein